MGADLCERILPRLGLSREEVDDAKQLVNDHLLMYHVSTRRDLDDVATIEEFCRSVRGREGLRDLYLLTVADLSTTSPTAMTSWKARMLDELYFAAEAHLAGQIPREDAELRVERVRAAVRAAWSGPRGGRSIALLESMPEPVSPGQRARVHPSSCTPASSGRARRAERLPRPGDVQTSRGGGASASWPTTVPVSSRASSAAITASRLEVLGAQVYSRQVEGRWEAVDIFWVRDRDGGTEGVEQVLARLERDVDDVCAGRVDASEAPEVADRHRVALARAAEPRPCRPR